jgi:hypothetical protein
MKQLIGRVASGVLFCLGDWVSRPMSHWDWAWLYPTYNWLMDASYTTQVWGGGAGPWQVDHTEKDTE